MSGRSVPRLRAATPVMWLDSGYERNDQCGPQGVDCVRKVHLVRHSLSYVSHKERKQVAADLKAIYQAATLAGAERHSRSSRRC